MRVTDLDKFSLEQVWRPYQTMMGHEKRLESAPASLEETAQLLSENSVWSRHVLARIAAIGVTFPRYIQHPLVNIVRAAQSTKDKTNV